MNANAVLDQLGVRDLVGYPFGRDLAGHMKNTADLHPAILRIADAAPETSVVVDDSPDALANAREAGTRTVLVAANGHPGAPHIDRVIGGIAELPEAISSL